MAGALSSRALRADSILTGVAALALIGMAALALSAVLHANWSDAVGGLIVSAIVAPGGLASAQRLRLAPLTLLDAHGRRRESYPN